MKQQRILAVDDEPHMLKLLERIITEKTPYFISTTSNSLTVPHMLEDAEYDLIISDLKMPGLDGMDILQLIRKNHRPEELIIITAFGSLETAVEAMSHGVFDYITKPFKKEEILFTIDRAMRWQKLKRKVERLQRTFLIEPFEEAKNAFLRDYVHAMAERNKGDPEQMVLKSGLSLEVIASVMRENAGETD